MREMKDSGIKWIGTIPQQWNVVKFKALFAPKSIPNSGDRELLSVYLDRGVIRYSDSSNMQVHKPSESLDKYQNVDVGDFVLNNQQAWRGSVGVSKYRGIISPAYLIYEMSRECSPQYMNYALRDCYMVQQYEYCSRGVGTIQRNIFPQWLKQALVLLPPLDEQKRIAEYLDEVCSQIDGLIADIQAQIDTLEQFKRSQIAETVTKGLLKNTTLRDSGAPWLGPIPSHWKTDKLKYHLTRSEPKNPGGMMVLSLYREYGIIPKNSRDDNHNQTSEDTSKYKYVKPGNFVVNKMKAWQGSVAVSDYEGIISPAYYVYSFVDNEFYKRYFHYLLRGCYKDEFMRLSGGMRVGQWDLSSADLENTIVLIPPIDEQKAISEYLDEKCAEIDGCIAAKKEQISALEAYKESVIFEYVTGKKEVE